jgi:SAM-dependent methyltransferase
MPSLRAMSSTKAVASAKPMTFYDEHPFDWAPAEPAAVSDATLAPSLAAMIQSLEPRSLVLDIGCGPGRVLGLLARRGLRCIGLDRSRVSVALAAARCRKPGAVGDNLTLPFASDSADAVISDGVIHHTDDPRKAFEENYRILKPGGRMYLAVYKPSGRYPALYKFPGGLIRRGLQHAPTRALVALLAQLPYFLVHFVRSRGKRTWSGARNLFYDYFVSPRVAFLSRETIEEWCSDAGAIVQKYDSNPGLNVHSFVVQKWPKSNATRNSQVPSAVQVLVGKEPEAYER